MHYEVLLESIKAQPFEPFSIVMSSGEKYSIEHPENVQLLKHAALIYTKMNRRFPEVVDEYVRASYLHMSALEPVAPPKPKRPRPRRSR